ncbi:MAG: hypothetical protein AAGM67_17605, partial [Bacteroidota bacterium]
RKSCFVEVLSSKYVSSGGSIMKGKGFGALHAVGNDSLKDPDFDVKKQDEIFEEIERVRSKGRLTEEELEQIFRLEATLDRMLDS